MSKADNGFPSVVETNVCSRFPSDGNMSAELGMKLTSQWWNLETHVAVSLVLLLVLALVIVFDVEIDLVFALVFVLAIVHVMSCSY